MRAKSALADEDYPFALKTLKEITDLNPAEGEYWAYLGWATYKENPDEIDAAKKIIKDALDLNNDLDNAWYFLGMLSLASGEQARIHLPMPHQAAPPRHRPKR